MPEQLALNQRRQGSARLRYVLPVVVALPFAAVIAVFAVVAQARPQITTSTAALARVTLPTGGGRITRVVAIGGRERQVIPVRLQGNQIVPAERLPAGERLTVQVTVSRPGWISWLAGKAEQVQVSETTPAPKVVSTFLTRPAAGPLTVSFTAPVVEVGAGQAGTLIATRLLAAPVRSFALSETASAGTADVALAARAWEIPTQTAVSWFPAGTSATAVASPSPGTNITPGTKITLTFSKPVANVLGSRLPPVRPSGSGSWLHLNAHTIQFVPHGYGYGIGASVQIALPAGVNLVGGTSHGADPVGQWTVPFGSFLALQQLLAKLGYLPVTFHPAAGATDVASTPAAEEALIVHPPQGTFSWRYPNTPARLKALWSPTGDTELTRGAVLAFQQTHGMVTSGLATAPVWKAMINAAVHNQVSTFGYTFVMVSETLPENIKVWHNGRIVVQGLANTGIPASPTALGTYAVYEHIPVGTMSGTNPNGTPYHDTGIPWISYFNGGDALHGFIRASYGFPQSVGCVEMPFSEAGQVYPYTPIGTIVNIVS